MREYHHECPKCTSQLVVIGIIGNQNDKLVTCSNSECEMSKKHFKGWSGYDRTLLDRMHLYAHCKHINTYV